MLEEYIDGLSLARLLKQRRLSERETRRIMLRLCAALQELHTLNIVHRDIKPDNIILRGDTVYLVDFDAARLYEPGSDTDTQILGTVGYAAPEQFGIYQSDKRSDLYAMGVLLNVMSTGKHPSVGKLVKGPLRKIIQRCTMVNPDDRYQSAAQLMRELRLSSWRCVMFATLAAVFAAAVLLTVGLVRRGGDDALVPSDNAVSTPDVTLEATPSPSIPSAEPAVPSNEPVVPSPEPVAPDITPSIIGPAPGEPTPVTPAVKPSQTSQNHFVHTEPNAIDYAPEQWTEFPLDKWVSLPYKTNQTRDNGKPGEGIEFKRFLAKRTSQGEVFLAVEFKSEQVFTCVVFEPPGNRLQSFANVPSEHTWLQVTLPVEELAQYKQIVFNFFNDNGSSTESAEAYGLSQNRNTIFIENYVIAQFTAGVPTTSYDSSTPVHFSAYTPWEWESFPINVWVQLPAATYHYRPNGQPSNGVSFTRVLAKKMQDGNIVFCVEFECSQVFFSSFAPEKLGIKQDNIVPAGTTSLSVIVPQARLATLTEQEQFIITLSNDSGRQGLTDEEWMSSQNTNMMYISYSVISTLLK